eukprot:10289327-Ditylum_brightwellii.AAC.1
MKRLECSFEDGYNSSGDIGPFFNAVEEEGDQMFDKKIISSHVEKMSGIPCNASMGHTDSNEVSSMPQMQQSTCLVLQQSTGLILLSRTSSGERDAPVPPNQNSNVCVPIFDAQ